MTQVSPSPRASPSSPGTPTARGEGRGEGRPQAPTQTVAAPHPSPLPTEEWGEGIAGATVRTTCPYCGVGCGVLATPDGKGGATIKGDPAHPANAGRLCSKGSALGETLGLETRLLHPIVDGATDDLDAGARPRCAASRSDTAAHGPEAIAFYLSGQLLTEDYYVANKLAKGLHRHAARRHQLAPVHGLLGGRPSPRLRRRRGAAVLRRSGARRPRRAGGLQRRLVPPDPLSAHPDGAGRARRARRQHRSAAHGHLRGQRPAPGRQARHRRHPVVRPARLAGRAQADRRGVHRGAHARLCLGAAARAAPWRPSLDAVADATGIDRQAIATFYGWFAATPRVVSCYSQGVNQSAQGTDKVNAIINCHLATGRIGKPGSGPLSLTGQPNAMGGREVGGLANMLAAHMGFSEAERDRVRRFWNAPNLVSGEGLKAVAMFDAVADGRIKALWVMGTNPAVSLPRADAMCDGAGQAGAARRLRERRRQRHGEARTRPPARGGLGREGRHGHQLRALHLAPARIPAAARECAARLVDAVRGGAATGLGRGVRLPLRRPISSTSTRASRASRTRARAPSTSRELPAQASRRSRASSPSSGRFGAGDMPVAAPVRRRRLLHQGSQGALRRHRPAPARSVRVRRLALRAQHRPRPRPVAHHDAHGAVAAPLHPHRRALRRDPSRRCDAPAAGAGNARAGHDGARLGRPARADQSRAAAGHAVRADPLVGREQQRRPHRRARAAGDRSLLRPARGQGDAGAHRAASRQQLRVPAVAPAAATRRAGLLGPRARILRPCAQLRARRAAQTAGPRGCARRCPRAIT